MKAWRSLIIVSGLAAAILALRAPMVLRMTLKEARQPEYVATIPWVTGLWPWEISAELDRQTELHKGSKTLQTYRLQMSPDVPRWQQWWIAWGAMSATGAGLLMTRRRA
jgi:hypothetical protein